MAVSESEIQQHIQIAAVRHNCFLMRNNSGAFKNPAGQWVHFGLGSVSVKQNAHIKSSDLIGFTIRNGVAVFTAIEVKREDWVFSAADKRSAAQLAFIHWVKAKGGIAGFCTSVVEFENLMMGNR